MEKLPTPKNILEIKDKELKEAVRINYFPNIFKKLKDYSIESPKVAMSVEFFPEKDTLEYEYVLDCLDEAGWEVEYKGDKVSSPNWQAEYHVSPIPGGTKSKRSKLIYERNLAKRQEEARIRFEAEERARNEVMVYQGRENNYYDEFVEATTYTKGSPNYFHREDGPALEFVTGEKHYYVENKLHRVGGPAVILPDGSSIYYFEGKVHREDGPAVHYTAGSPEGYRLEYWLNNEEVTKEAFDYYISKTQK